MPSEPEAQITPEEPPLNLTSMNFRELLESPSDGEFHIVPNFAKPRYSRAEEYDILYPPIMLDCADEECNGPRLCDKTRGPSYLDRDDQRVIFDYSCRNCKSYKKTFALIAFIHEQNWVVTKVGEFPPYGPSTPAKLTSLLGQHSKLFFKGRQCEIHGQGIGAFAYYRRIVELVKEDILEMILSVARLSTGNEELIAELEMAKKEQQFSKAVSKVKHSLPVSLLISGHNPLTVLHDCLSKGIHELDDDECLKRATAVREVLAALVQRVNELRTDQSTLVRAINDIRS